MKGLQTIWTGFKSDAALCDAALIASLEAASVQLKEAALFSRDALLRQAAIPARPPGLEALDETLTSEARSLLLEPLEKYRAHDPYQRALRAFSDHDAMMEDVILTVPEVVAVSRRDWMDVIGTAGLSWSKRFSMLVRIRKRPVPLRHNFLVGFYTRRVRRTAQQGSILRSFLEANVDLVGLWQVFAESRFSEASTQPSQHDLTSEITRLLKRLDSHWESAAQAITALKVWLNRRLDSLANTAGMRLAPDHETPSALRKQYFTSMEFWSRQRRAVEAGIEVETGLLGAQTGLCNSVRELILTVEKEHQDMVNELDMAIDGLHQPSQAGDAAFPAGHVDFVPAAHRINLWRVAVRRCLDNVPEKAETASGLRNLPGLRTRWRVQYPRRALERSVRKFVDGTVESVLRDSERQSGTTVRQVEHAREVLEFAASAARSGDAGERELEAEGIVNARSLLEFHRQQLQAPDLEQPLAAALASSFRHTYRVLQGERGRIWREAMRRGLPAAARLFWQRISEARQEVERKIKEWSPVVYRQLLIRVGWTPAPSGRMAHVIPRPYLGSSFRSLQLNRVPMLYQRLFRLQPLEDARFLIGRSEEMAALSEARRVWERGGAASVLIVGERGSGKTSLINCALEQVFSGVDVVRGEFSKRISSEEELREFLSNLTGCANPAGLDSALQTRRRIIVLEELERTFLRRVHHFHVIRALMNLVSRTSRTTLWIMATNHSSFRLLNAAINVDPHFSHRINAMAVEPERLKEAILMRHSLSGLRLQVKEDMKAPSWPDRILRSSDGEDRERRLHEAIYQYSFGVFRSAFSLWLGQIDRVENGVLYMDSPARPEHERLMDSLGTDELFILAGILQHGSLTSDETGAVFDVPEFVAQRWLDNLLAREIIEADPVHPGYRVVPMAAAIVQQALYRKNLA